MVDSTGVAVPIHQLSAGPHLASWSRGEDWVVVVEDSSVTLVSHDEGFKAPLGVLVPDSHWIFNAGCSPDCYSIDNAGRVDKFTGHHYPGIDHHLDKRTDLWPFNRVYDCTQHFVYSP